MTGIVIIGALFVFGWVVLAWIMRDWFRGKR